MIKAITAMAAAAVIAAAITFSPGFAPKVEAGQTTSISKAEPPASIAKAEPPAQTVSVDARCAYQAWPHIDAACLRGSGNATVQPVRVIATNRH